MQCHQGRASTDSVNYPGYPAVAWNGSLYLVAWNNANGVVVRTRQGGPERFDAAFFDDVEW